MKLKKSTKAKIDTATFSASNITVVAWDYFTNVSVSPFNYVYSWADNDTTLLMEIDTSSLRADTNYKITITSPVSNPIRFKDGLRLVQGTWGSPDVRDWAFEHAFTVRFPDGVQPYIVSFGRGLDLNLVPPHIENIPVSFSERMAQIFVEAEDITHNRTVFDLFGYNATGLYPTKPLELNTEYYITYQSSDVKDLCAATMDLSGEPLTIQGFTGPKSDIRSFHTAKIRIDEPQVNPGKVAQHNINPLRVAGRVSPDVTRVRIIVEKDGQIIVDRNLFSFTPASDGNKNFSTDEIVDDYNGIYHGIYLPSSGVYSIKVQAFGGQNSSTYMGEDFVCIEFRPVVTATVIFPVEMLEHYMLNTSQFHPELFSMVYQNGTYQLEGGWIYLGYGTGALMQIGGAIGGPIGLAVGAVIAGVLSSIWNLDVEIHIDKVHPRYNTFKIEYDPFTGPPYSNRHPYGGLKFYINSDLCVDSGEVIRYGTFHYQLAGHCPIRGIDIAGYFYPYFEVEGDTKYRFRVGLDPEIRIVLTGGVDFPGVSGETDQIIADRLPDNLQASAIENLQEQKHELQNEIIYNLPTIWYYSSISRGIGPIPRIHSGNELSAILNSYLSPSDLYSFPYGFYGLADAYYLYYVGNLYDYGFIRKRVYFGEEIGLWMAGGLAGRRCDDVRTPTLNSQSEYETYFTCGYDDKNNALPYIVLNSDDCPQMNNAFFAFIPEQAHYIQADEIPFTSFNIDEISNFTIYPAYYGLNFNPKGFSAPFVIKRDLGRTILFHFDYRNCE